MSISVLNFVWKHSQHKGSTRLVLLALADYSDDSGRSWPSIGSLAKKCGLSERYVQLLLRSLESTGDIEIIPGERYGKSSNLYLISMNPASPVNLDSPTDETNLTPGVKPASPKPSINRQVTKMTLLSDGEEAIQVFAAVTGMMAFPSRSKDQDIERICMVIKERGVDGAISYLKPFFQDWVSRKRKDGRFYSRLNSTWLDWAIAGEIPKPYEFTKNKGGHKQPGISKSERQQAIIRRAFGIEEGVIDG